jgi:hypothetical protein
MTPYGTLTDTGPLFAMVDPDNQPEQFQRCTTIARTFPVPFVTTWPCFSEAMHLTGRTGDCTHPGTDGPVSGQANGFGGCLAGRFSGNSGLHTDIQH